MVIGRISMRILLPDLCVVTGFFVVPPLVGLVAALTTLRNLYAFWPIFCVATTVAVFATLLLAVPTFLIQEQNGGRDGASISVMAHCSVASSPVLSKYRYSANFLRVSLPEDPSMRSPRRS
jgi:hypothetical protein